MLLLNMARLRKASFFLERQAAFAPSPEVVFCVLISCGSRALSSALAELASQLLSRDNQGEKVGQSR
jgi:hypothetical protein